MQVGGAGNPRLGAGGVAHALPSQRAGVSSARIRGGGGGGGGGGDFGVYPPGLPAFATMDSIRVMAPSPPPIESDATRQVFRFFSMGIGALMLLAFGLC
eukprot:5539040-Prymnesium_polylepis.1